MTLTQIRPDDSGIPASPHEIALVTTLIAGAATADPGTEFVSRRLRQEYAATETRRRPAPKGPQPRPPSVVAA